MTWHQYVKLITTCSKLWKVLFLAPSVWVFCLCEVSGTAEWICAKFMQKMCLVPRLDEFELQRSKFKVTRGKMHFLALLTACVLFIFGKTSLPSALSRLSPGDRHHDQLPPQLRTDRRLSVMACHPFWCHTTCCSAVLGRPLCTLLPYA